MNFSCSEELARRLFNAGGSAWYIVHAGSIRPVRFGACPVPPRRVWVCVVTVRGRCDQATKGARWMTWRREAMKDVVACDKPRGAGKQALILGFPNGETRPFGVIRA